MSLTYVSGPLGVRQIVAEKAGDATSIHNHNWPHVTYFPKGAFLVEKLEPISLDENGKPTDFKVVASVVKRATDGMNWITVPKDAYHRLTAKEPGSIAHCIFTHRDALTGEECQEYNGWQQAYG
jgi:hypothetical protein